MIKPSPAFAFDAEQEYSIIMTIASDNNKSRIDWTTPELANHTGLSSVYIRLLCRSGVLEARKRGQAWVISDDEVKRWLASRK